MMKSLDHLRVFGTVSCIHPKAILEEIRLFGRMVGYLNDKDGYQVYVPSLNKIVHSHYVYFKPERVCTSSVVERGWKT